MGSKAKKTGSKMPSKGKPAEHVAHAKAVDINFGGIRSKFNLAMSAILSKVQGDEKAKSTITNKLEAFYGEVAMELSRLSGTPVTAT